MEPQRGQALVIVLVVTLVLQVAAWAFLSGMFVELRLAGGGTRSLAALHLADAGLRKTLWTLESELSTASDSPEGAEPNQELGSGTFAVETVEPLPNGLIALVVRGDVAGTVRRVKALVRAGPEALGYSLFVRQMATFEGEARTYVVPCRAGASGCRRGGHLAAGEGVRFVNSGITFNEYRGDSLTLREGDIADASILGSAAASNPALGFVDIVLAGDSQLRFGAETSAISLVDLRRRISGLGIGNVRHRGPVQEPVIDVARYRLLAEANTANAAMNSAAANLGRQPSLRIKTHSRYTEEEFIDLLDYIQGQPSRTLQGVVFVDGNVLLKEENRVVIVDGALVVKGDIEVTPGARLEIRHGDTSRTLPGMLVVGPRNILLEQATIVVDGLIFSGGDVHVLGGVLDVAGAVVAQNYLGRGGTAVIRYDAAVLSTVGLHRAGRGLGELMSWQELP